MTSTVTPLETHAPPELRLINVNDLQVDPQVQRSIDPKWVEAHKDKFSEAALGVLHVSERPNGFLHIIDGQHRRELILAAGQGHKKFPAMVYAGLSPAEEALMFRALNDRRAVHPIDLFRVRVIEGDQVATTLQRILSEHGWLVRHGGGKGSFSAVSALERVYHGMGAKKEVNNTGICATVISVITQSWGHDPVGVRSEIIFGLGALLIRHGRDVDLAKLTAQMSQTTPKVLIGRARSLSDMMPHGRVRDAVAECLIQMHNKGRPEDSPNRLPRWWR